MPKLRLGFSASHQEVDMAAAKNGESRPQKLAPMALWIVEDNANYRNGLCRVLERSPLIQLAGQSDSVEAAVDEIRLARVKPAVILLDVGLPGQDGITGITSLRGIAPDARIVLLTVFEDEDKIFRAVCAGVSGYLLKSASLHEIVDAIREVSEGGAPMHPRVASQVLEFLRTSASPAKGEDNEPLLDREKQVLQLMADGYSKKQIAYEMRISIHTVTFHLRRIYEKLHVNTNTGAIAKAIRQKLI
jgi:DNA-binding NarL/FixJ family response regulator